MVSIVRRVLDTAAEESPDRAAVCTPDAELTYAQLRDLVDEYARALVGLGIARGDRVGMQMYNTIDAIGLLFGCATLGATLVPINTRNRGDEIAHVLLDSGARVVLTHDVGSDVVDLRERLLESGVSARSGADGGATYPSLETIVDLSHDGHPPFLARTEFFAAGDGIDLSDRREATDTADPLVLLYTSGTTSVPKGCELSQEQFVAISSAIGEMWPILEGDSMWNVLPMFHVSGIMPMLATFLHGGTWLTMPRFDAPLAIRMIKARKPTLLWPAFTTIWQDILTHPEFDPADFSSVRSLLCIGPRDTLALIESKLPTAPIVNCYGMTETTGVSFLPSSNDPAEVRLGYAGRPVTGLEVSIRDPESGRPLPGGARGVLWLRGPTVFAGYLNDEDKNRETFDADGWFCTGDLGRMSSEGLFTYEGREKDMLKVGGENVAAAEVEALLSTHPGVKLSAVVGVPDDRYGEVPVAFVEPIPGATLAEDEVISFCSSRVAGYKVPRRVWLVEEWPMSATKIRKGELRDRALEVLTGRGASALAER